MKPEQGLLDQTLAAAKADQQTVSNDGKPVAKLPDGMRMREVPTHIDDRGSVVEMFDTRWDWHPDPIEFVYSFTIRPGIVKGWGLHQHHEDRYFLLQGKLSWCCSTCAPKAPPMVRFPGSISRTITGGS